MARRRTSRLAGILRRATTLSTHRDISGQNSCATSGSLSNDTRYPAASDVSLALTDPFVPPTELPPFPPHDESPDRDFCPFGLRMPPRASASCCRRRRSYKRQPTKLSNKSKVEALAVSSLAARGRLARSKRQTASF